LKVRLCLPEILSKAGTGRRGQMRIISSGIRLERSLASYDTPHRAVISYILDLPFGKNQPIGRNLTGLTDRASMALLQLRSRGGCNPSD
jgi:hypothetical protein